MTSEELRCLAEWIDTEATESGGLTVEKCATVAHLLHLLADDTAHFEGLMIVPRPPAGVARFPELALCVAPPPGGGAQIIPFPRRPET